MGASPHRLIANPALIIRTLEVESSIVASVETTTSEAPTVLSAPAYERMSSFLAGEQDDGTAELSQELFQLKAVIEETTGPAACGYHAATRDHPFLDMSKGHQARRVDNELMANFSARDSYPSVYLDLPHDISYPLEDHRDLEFAQVWSEPHFMLSLMISGTFGKRRHLAAYHDPYWDYHQVELLFKPIPSGGSRHPTEAFFSVEKSANLPTGIYHFDVRSNMLVRISPEPLTDVLSDAKRDPSATEVVVVLLGSMVERAMFRYRDPRSFRALLVDAGHADAHLGALAAYCNWSYESRALIDTDDLPQRLGMSGDEMPILLAGLLQGWI